MKKPPQTSNASQEIINLDEINLDEILAPLMDMIGLDPVKQEIRNITYLAQSRALRQVHGLSSGSISLHMVFSGPPGTGKTTVARLLGEILHKLGYLKKGHVVETDRGGLVGEYVGQTAEKTKAVVESAMGGILFIDEAYALHSEDGGDWDYGSEAIATLLKMMEDHRNDFIVIAAGYTNEMHKFVESNPGLKSRFSINVEFPNYSADEMVQIYKFMSEKEGYITEDAAIDKLRQHLSTLRTSHEINNFGNARGIRNIFERTVINQANRIITTGVKDKDGIVLITQDDILKREKKLEPIPLDELQALLLPLSKLTGMENIKKDISDLTHLLHARIIREKHGLPTTPVVLHSIFSGPPGTGKTTVARLLGKIYKRLGYISSGHVVEVDKSRMVGKYLGSTPDIVKNLLKEAEGGILFIDEAYALTDSNDGDYGREALTTVLKGMEDNRENLIVIAAGYEEEMKNFLKSNPGLKSRFPHAFQFKTYTPEELVQIFVHICAEQKYEPTPDALEGLLKWLQMLDKSEINTMGNGRLVRNIFEKTIMAQSRRVTHEGMTEEEMSSIRADDLRYPEKDEDKKIGFV